MKKEINVGIIGCGVSGLCALTQLLDDDMILDHLREIIIIDARPLEDSNICANASEELYLNTSANINSLLVNSPNHFYEWLDKNKEDFNSQNFSLLEVKPEGFYPRKLFFYYMKDVFNTYLEKAKSFGIKIKMINQYVEEIQREDDGRFRLNLADKNSVLVHHAISAIGDGKCINKYDYLQGHPNYISKPCVPIENYSDIFKKKQVLILGTMLSAVDALLLLLKFSPRITLSSGSGTFPAVRSSYMSNVNKYEELLKFRDINALLQNFLCMVKTAYGSDEDQTNIGYKSKDDSWCHYVAPFLNRVNDLWEDSSEEEKIFYKNVYNAHRTKRFLSAIPNVIADKILPKIKKSEISVKSGLQNVVYETSINKYKASYLDGKYIYFDACINATAATNNSKKDLFLPQFLNTPNFHILGDSNIRNFMNNGIFLYVREVQKRIIPSIRNELEVPRFLRTNRGI